jgi:dinuclear metal center YbgI/SA1388 family protein
MYATVDAISSIMEDIAPTAMAMADDRVGLIAGDPASEVRRVLVALEATGAVLDEARAAGAQMLVTHHPPLRPFAAPPAAIVVGRPHGDLLARALLGGVALYAAHTNYDAAPGGMNDLVAARVGLIDAEPVGVFKHDPVYKLVVFVPKGHEDAVRDAIAAAGAGCIGNYSHCTFQAAGTGTFKPLQGTRPFLGRVGELERADELRLETVVPSAARERVVAAMLKSHPYEEVAWDLVRLENASRPVGMARMGRLDGPVTLGGLAERVRTAFGVDHVRVVGDPGQDAAPVVTNAGLLVPGVLEEAASRGARSVILGEIGYSPACQAEALGLGVIELGHYPCEVLCVADIARRLEERLRAMSLDTGVVPSRCGKYPFRFI